MTELTSTGFRRTRLDERLAELRGAVQAIFGNDIDIGSDTMDGQHIALFAERIASLDELAELVWQSFDPDAGADLSLSRLVKINGIERSEGAYSVVTLSLTGTPNILIPARSIVSNASGSVVVYTSSDVRLDVLGNGSVTASPNQIGAITAPANTLNSIRSPVYGWDSVTNTAPMTIGKLREQDNTLRLRRSKSVSRGNRNVVDALWAAVNDLPGVIEARVLENSGNSIDENGLPAHSIHVVVLGGSNQDIADTIWARKTGGTTLLGQTSVTVQDAQGGQQVVKFSRPTEVREKARITVSPRIGWTISKPAQIKQVLVDWVSNNQTTGAELANAALYTPLNSLTGFVTEKIELARFSNTFAEQSLSMAFYERPSIDVGDIQVVTT